MEINMNKKFNYFILQACFWALTITCFVIPSSYAQSALTGTGENTPDDLMDFALLSKGINTI